MLTNHGPITVIFKTDRNKMEDLLSIVWPYQSPWMIFIWEKIDCKAKAHIKTSQWSECNPLFCTTNINTSTTKHMTNGTYDHCSGRFPFRSVQVGSEGSNSDYFPFPLCRWSQQPYLLPMPHLLSPVFFFLCEYFFFLMEQVLTNYYNKMFWVIGNLKSPWHAHLARCKHGISRVKWGRTLILVIEDTNK